MEIKSVDIEKLPNLIQSLYKIVQELRALFPTWNFTPDGKFVGDIGEVLACYHFDLEPLPNNQKMHDAKTKDGKHVQIKITQRKSLGLGNTRRDFEHLIAYHLQETGEPKVIYNGSGKRVLESVTGNAISINTLRRLNKNVPESERIKKVR